MSIYEASNLKPFIIDEWYRFVTNGAIVSFIRLVGDLYYFV